MNWVVLGIISMFAITVATILEKKALFKVHAATYTTAITAVTALLSLALLPYINLRSLSPASWILIIAITATGAIGFLLIAKAMRREEVSYITPLLNFNPALVAIFAFFILKETLTLTQGFGIGLIVAGAFVLTTSHGHGKFFSIKKLFASKAQIFIWFALTLYAIGAIGYKYLINDGISPLLLMLVTHILMTMMFLTLLIVKYNGFHDLKHGWNEAGLTMFIGGIFFFISRISVFLAFGITSIALVLALKRMSILLITFIGGELFHEHQLKQRMLAASIMVFGVLFLI